MNKQFLEATISIRGVVCRPDDQILLIRRSNDGGWELPGGRIHRGEAVTDCLQREVREETGLAVTVCRPLEATSWQNTAENDRFAVYYHCTTEGSDVTLSDEHTDSRWLSKEIACEQLSEPQAAATLQTVPIETTD